MKLSALSLLAVLAFGFISLTVLGADGDAPPPPAPAAPADAPATPPADKPAENATPASAQAAPVTPGPSAADDAKLSKLELIIRETKASEAQQVKLKEKVASSEKALAAWDATNAPKLQKLDADMAAAKKANNSSDYQSFFQEKMSLKSGRDRLTQNNADALLDILTPEQRLAWSAYEIYQLMLVRFKVCGLTEDQQAKIRELCPATAKEEAAVRDRDGNVATVRGKLIKNIHDSILTEEQRIKLDGKMLPPTSAPSPRVDNRQPTPSQDNTQTKPRRRGGRGQQNPPATQ